MKNIVLIGASGFVGSHILAEALDRGLNVTAIVRHPDEIKIKNKNLTVKKLDVSDEAALIDACKGADAVISAYNPGWKNPDIYNELLRVYPNILDGVKRSGVKRFLVSGGAGILFVEPGITAIDKGGFPPEILPGVESLAKFFYEYLAKEKDLDWAYLCPSANLIDGTRTGKYRMGKDDMIFDEKGESKISVQDLAKAMIDEVMTPQHHREKFTVGY